MEPHRDCRKLTNPQREFVVTRLAGYELPMTVASALHAEFGVTITRQALARYDPTRNPRCAPRWKDLFFAARRAILDDKAASAAARHAQLMALEREGGKLTNQQKEYVVTRLAGYDSPSAVARGLREDFGVTISKGAIACYDPTRNLRCPERWRDLFYAARRAILDGKAGCAAADKMVRVRLRERMALDAMEQENFALANSILDSIARELGDTVLHQLRLRNLSDFDRARTLAVLLDKIKAAQAAAPAGHKPVGPS